MTDLSPQTKRKWSRVPVRLIVSASVSRAPTVTLKTAWRSATRAAGASSGRDNEWRPLLLPASPLASESLSVEGLLRGAPATWTKSKDVFSWKMPGVSAHLFANSFTHATNSL